MEDKDLELIQFRSSKKQILRDLAEKKDISLNALLNIIIDEYLKKNNE